MNRNHKLRILVLGITGMLGSAMFRNLSATNKFSTFGTIRDSSNLGYFAPKLHNQIISDVHLDTEYGLIKAFDFARPDVVINCVGIIKQHPLANDHLESLNINSTLPHRIASYCAIADARLIHFSTDCVFSGATGRYTECDNADADDLYGRTKYLGEVNCHNAVTLRTSIIGHELSGARSLIDWFLSQSGQVRGFRKAVFSGLPTIEVAQIVGELVVPNPNLRGLYHLSVDSISKHDLLTLVASTYGKQIEIVPDDQVVIDRSLNSERFRAATGFAPKPWPRLVEEMYRDYKTILSQ